MNEYEFNRFLDIPELINADGDDYRFCLNLYESLITDCMWPIEDAIASVREYLTTK